MNSDNSLEKTILTLEEKLLSSSTRNDPDELAAMLDDGFVEFGSSGKIYNKQDVINALKNQEALNYTISGFKINSLSDEVILAAYKIEIILAGKQESKKSLRSSIWKRSENKWKIIFHQGTNVESY